MLDFLQTLCAAVNVLSFPGVPLEMHQIYFRKSPRFQWQMAMGLWCILARDFRAKGWTSAVLGLGLGRLGHCVAECSVREHHSFCNDLSNSCSNSGSTEAWVELGIPGLQTRFRRPWSSHIIYAQFHFTISAILAVLLFCLTGMSILVKFKHSCQSIASILLFRLLKRPFLLGRKYFPFGWP